jgi:predicted enzyme related to lactoylglutathione lyase
MTTQPKVGDICWTELATHDIQAAKEFYGTVFGWEFIDHNFGEMTYTMIKNNNQEFGGMWAIPKEMQKECPPHWMSYILVESLDQAVEKACSHKAQIKKPATQVGDMGRFAIIIDPTGAHIALWEPLKA